LGTAAINDLGEKSVRGSSGFFLAINELMAWFATVPMGEIGPSGERLNRVQFERHSF
jgi:hypothetical protein